MVKHYTVAYLQKNIWLIVFGLTLDANRVDQNKWSELNL